MTTWTILSVLEEKVETSSSLLVLELLSLCISKLYKGIRDRSERVNVVEPSLEMLVKTLPDQTDDRRASPDSSPDSYIGRSDGMSYQESAKGKVAGQGCRR